MISSTHILGFRMFPYEGRIGHLESSFIHSYVHLRRRRRRRSMSLRMEALEEGSLGASLHGGALGARVPII
jgi:hypothetical protein